MERDLKTVLQSFLNNFDANNINNYFANDFSDDWDIYLKNGTPIDVLEYLNDSFYNIDVDYRDTDIFEEKVKEALTHALKLLDAK